MQKKGIYCSKNKQGSETDSQMSKFKQVAENQHLQNRVFSTAFIETAPSKKLLF